MACVVLFNSVTNYADRVSVLNKICFLGLVMAGRNCIMGCKLEIGERLHTVTRDPKRKAEWCRILGVYPRTKRAFICGKHFLNCYVYGDRLSRYAMPEPPDSRRLNSQTMTNINFPYLNSPMYRESKICGNIINTSYNDSFMGCEIENEPSETFSESDPLHINHDSEASLKGKDETKKSQETVGKVEDFEIRKGSTNDMIIKGRYIQTNDYLVVSYTPPRKWSLQEQIKILDTACEKQIKNIKQLNKEKYRLSLELNKHKRLLPKLRYLQKRNRFLCTQLKMYKIMEKERRKHAKERSLKRQNL